MEEEVKVVAIGTRTNNGTDAMPKAAWHQCLKCCTQNRHKTKGELNDTIR